MTGLPRVRIDDLLIHPRDADLIVATHGRSFYIADDITPLEQMASPGAGPKVFDPRPAVLWKNDREATQAGDGQAVPGREPAGRDRDQLPRVVGRRGDDHDQRRQR